MMFVAIKTLDSLRKYLGIPDNRLKKISKFFQDAVFKQCRKPLANFEKVLVSVLESNDLKENEKLFLMFWLGFEYGRHTVMAEVIASLYSGSGFLGLNPNLVLDILNSENKFLRKKFKNF